MTCDGFFELRHRLAEGVSLSKLIEWTPVAIFKQLRGHGVDLNFQNLSQLLRSRNWGKEVHTNA
jgi:hypothetical protein